MTKANGKIYMTGADLRAELERIGVTQMAFGRLIGVDGRTVRSWVSDAYPVPKVVAQLLLIMQAQRLKKFKLEEQE